jgi:sugar lactone lactonase YvrE
VGRTTTKVVILSGRGLIKRSDGHGGPVILKSGQMSTGVSKPQSVEAKERLSIEDFAQFIRFTAKEDNPLKRTYQRAWRWGMETAGKDYYGVLSIASNPTEARVYIDDYPVGDTPLAIREEPGRHIVKVSLRGYPLWRNMAEVKGGRTTSLRADLAPPAPGVAVRPTTVQGKLVTRIAVVEGKVALKKPTASGGLEELIVVGANQSTQLVEEAVLEINRDGDRVRSIAKAEIVSEKPISPVKIETLQESDRQVIAAAATSIQRVVAEVRSLEAGLAKNYGKLSVASIPVGGEVYLNGEPRGQAPLVVRAEEGTYQVRVRVSGLPDWVREVKVAADQETFVEARFIDTEPPSISLRPVGEAKAGEPISVEAQIQDNLRVDRATLLYRSGTVGAFRETAMAEVGGSDYRGTIPGEAVKPPGVYYYVQASDGTNRAIAPADSSRPGFIPAVEPLGNLIVDSNPPGAAVTLDGEPKGRTPVTVSGVKAGLRSLSLSLDGYRPWRGEVSVEGGAAARSSVTLEPLPGSISVSSSPAGAVVYLDGEPKGQTPTEIGQVAVGNHQIKVSLKGYRDWTDRVSVGPGGKVSRRVALTLMTGWVSITSGPTGAKTTVDGKPIGQTPLERVELPVGDHRLNLVKDRFAPVDAAFTVTDDAETKLSYRLEQRSFAVDISSNPAGARVYVGGTLRGATPLKGLDLSVGDHPIRIAKDRYAPYEGRLAVKPGKEPIPFNFDLTPLFGTLKVTTVPAGASVYLQGRQIGRTPLELPDVPVGRHDLRIERDKYKPAAIQALIEGDETNSIDLTLETKPGYLDVRSVPSGAKVYLGDRYVGDTPVGRVELQPGDYTVRVVKPKFADVSLPARIESDEATSLSLNLPPLPGYLSVISSPEGAEVRLDGEVLGVTPLIGMELKAGSYKLSLAKPDHRVAETIVSVESSETATLDLTLQYLFGSLKVSSRPAGARVDLDGSRAGSTPLTLTKVGIGRHRIKLSLEDYQDQEGEVIIESNRPSEFSSALKIKPGAISLTSDPADSLVYLNGKYVGNAPLSLTDLQPGAYDVALTHTGYEVWERKGLKVSPGVAVNIRAQLDKHILYQEVRVIGKEGPEDGRLSLPIAVYGDTDGSLYIADAGRHRVVKYSEDGKFLLKIGGVGSQSEDGQFNLPRGLAVDKEGNFCVSDSLNNRIQKFDQKGSFILKFGKRGSGPGEFNKPAGIAIDPQSDVWVVDSENHRVQKFSAEGKYLFSFGGAGSGDGQFDTPEGIAIDGNGNIYVVDWGNSRVQKFSPDGKFLSSFGGPGRGKGQFVFPNSATVDKAGDIYVTDSGNNRIQRFDSGGNFRMYIQPVGKSVESFAGPQGVSATGDGVLIVVEKDASQVRILRPVWDQAYNPKI